MIIAPPASSPENSVSAVPPVVQSMLMSQKNMDGSLTKGQLLESCRNIIEYVFNIVIMIIIDSEIPVQNTAWQGYVFAGDNLDCNIRPRHQTVLSQTRSVHWFNSIAVQDRSDFSLFADTIPTPNISSFDLNYLLPDADDSENLISNVGVIVGRLLVKHLSQFSQFSHLVTSHIKHPRCLRNHV